MATDAFGNRGEEERSDRLLILAFFLLTIAAVAAMLVHEERAAIDDPLIKAQKGEIKPLSELSLVRQERFATALAKIAREAGAGAIITNLRVDPIQVSAITQDPEHHQKSIVVDTALDVHSNAAGAGNSEGIAPSAVDPAAPQRILDGLRRQDADPQRLNYMVGDKDSWEIFVHVDALDAHYTAAADGSGVQKR